MSEYLISCVRVCVNNTCGCLKPSKLLTWPCKSDCWCHLPCHPWIFPWAEPGAYFCIRGMGPHQKLGLWSMLVENESFAAVCGYVTFLKHGHVNLHFLGATRLIHVFSSDHLQHIRRSFFSELRKALRAPLTWPTKQELTNDPAAVRAELPSPYRKARTVGSMLWCLAATFPKCHDFFAPSCMPRPWPGFCQVVPKRLTPGKKKRINNRMLLYN